MCAVFLDDIDPFGPSLSSSPFHCVVKKSKLKLGILFMQPYAKCLESNHIKNRERLRELIIECCHSFSKRRRSKTLTCGFFDKLNVSKLALFVKGNGDFQFLDFWSAAVLKAGRREIVSCLGLLKDSKPQVKTLRQHRSSFKKVSSPHT